MKGYRRKRLAGYIARETRFRGQYRLARFISGNSPIVRIDDALLELELGDYVSDQIFSHGAYEPATLALAKSLCGRDEWFIDVGAHIGQYTMVLGAKGCRVLGLEPNYKTFGRYLRNIQLNDLSDKVIPISCAAGRDPAVGRLTLSHSSNSGGSSLIGRGALQNYAPVMPIGRIIEAIGLPYIALMKMDIEGFEVEAISSLGSLLPKNLIIEWLGPSGQSLVAEFQSSDLWAACKKLGFTAFDIDGVPIEKVIIFKEQNVLLRRVLG